MIKQSDDGILFSVKIVPNSSKNDISVEDDFLKVKVTAQPIENKANKALIEVLSKYLKAPKTTISIIKGETSKEKVLFVKSSELVRQSEMLLKLTK